MAAAADGAGADADEFGCWVRYLLPGDPSHNLDGHAVASNGGAVPGGGLPATQHTALWWDRTSSFLNSRARHVFKADESESGTYLVL